MGRGTGYGKTILIGDQFVCEGVPAIVSSLPYETVAVVQRTEGSGWCLEDNRREVPGYKESKKELQRDSIDRILEVMGIDMARHRLTISYGGDLLAGSGVGASAASCVSLARALNEEFALGLNIDKINQVAFEGEFAYHGTPSGVDNTASCYGGLLLYRLQGERREWEPIETGRPIHIVLANSGVSADTRKLDELVEREKKKNPRAFSDRLNRITAQVFRMKEALEDHDLETAGGIMTQNHALLVDMGLSHEKLVYLCDLAVRCGALGAKLTGGGMGGYMIALAPDADVQDRLAGRFREEGFPVIVAEIGGS
ncbi:MAG: mevalonate kinase [Spirochaetota bacterium]